MQLMGGTEITERPQKHNLRSFNTLHIDDRY
jgi:hypothetical protein